MAEDSEEETAQAKELQSRFTAAEIEGLGFKGEPRLQTMIRFLRARKHKPEDSESMMRELVKWRADFGVDADAALGEDGVLGFDKCELMQFYPANYCGYDKLGRPMWLEQQGRFDLKNMFAVVSLDRLLRLHVVMCEELVHRLVESAKKNGRGLKNGSVTIVDMDGFSMRMVNR